MRIGYVGCPGGAAIDLSEHYRREIGRAGELQICELDPGDSPAGRLELCRVMRGFDALLLCRHSHVVPADIVRDPGRLQYVCADVGSLRQYVADEIIGSRVVVSNWGDAPTFEIAEGALCLLLAAMKDVHRQIVEVRDGGWKLDRTTTGGTLFGTHLGVYGAGLIGRTFIELVRPLGPVVHVFDTFVETLPEDCIRESSLEALFTSVRVLAVHAGLTAQTRGSITAGLLAQLPDGAVVVNTARGALFDQDALFAELESGRLRAGLDVLEPDELPAGHPARKWSNVIFSAHQIFRGWPKPDSNSLSRARRIAVENLCAFAQGRSPQWCIDRERWSRMT